MQHQITGPGRKRMRRNISLIALATASCMGGLAVSVPAASAAPVRAPAMRNDFMAVVASSALSDLQTFQSTGDREARDRFVSTRDALAASIAVRLGIDPARMKNAWSDADMPHQTALLAALSQLGVPYRRNMSAPGVGFDCSGLTAYAWSVAGQDIPHQSRTQINAAGSRNANTAQAGDLVYYPGHVMMYLGVDLAIVHAPNSGRTIEVGFAPARRGVRFANPMS